MVPWTTRDTSSVIQYFSSVRLLTQLMTHWCQYWYNFFLYSYTSIRDSVFDFARNSTQRYQITHKPNFGTYNVAFYVLTALDFALMSSPCLIHLLISLLFISSSLWPVPIQN